jgi:hypothetical protein
MISITKFIPTLALVFICSCTNERFTYSITTTKTQYLINDTIILTNQNLQHLIDGIENSTLVSLNRFKEVPEFIRNFLMQRNDGDFLIADVNQPFAAGCTREENEPGRQVTYMAINNEYFIMSYKIGGIALMGKILILQFRENHMIDFWNGNGFWGLDSKEKIIAYLKENKSKPWGLNTNITYI